MGICVLSNSTKGQGMGRGPCSMGHPRCLAGDQHSLSTGAATDLSFALVCDY